MFGPLSPDTFMAEINTTLQKISYSNDGRLRDRLQMDDQTGSLTITNSKTTDIGVYQLQITNSKETFYKRYNVFVTEPGQSSGAVAVVCIVLLTAAVITGVGVCCYHRMYSRLKCFKCTMCSEDSKNEMKRNEMTEEDSIRLHTGIAKPRQYDQILWRFGPQDSHISRIPLRNRETLPKDDERFTIELFYVDSLQSSEGEDITIDTGISDLQRDDRILWSFGSEDNIIAKRDGDISQDLIDVDDGISRDRLEMDDQTGSLTIMNSKSTDSGVYHLQISSRNKVLYKKFTVCLRAGDSSTLNTDVTKPEDGDDDTGIAEISRVRSKTSVHEGNREKNREDAVESSQRENSKDIPLIRTYSGTSV
ncbi:hypothetical protein Q8A67_001474 [Cirrhinus molitorella]|uniref:Immunoglobulin subtype domain-containing protein n=1 Tax=Cirrhinus molitorella TaxID=172907 RepID=A0AA88QHT3_9TELE|nr:hypothetical protein Q8A67_001474 [Cirrhinus molitorella]